MDWESKFQQREHTKSFQKLPDGDKILVTSILEDNNPNNEEIKEAQHKARQSVHQANKEADVAKTDTIMRSISPISQQAITL